MLSPSGPRHCVLIPLLALAAVIAPAQVRTSNPVLHNLVISVTDENGMAVPSAQVFLRGASASPILQCQTDFAGHCYFRGLAAQAYVLRVEKPGFYALAPTDVQVGTAPGVDVRLQHLQERKEVVDVVESPPSIDPAQTSAAEQITGKDILNIPYPATHDYRNVLTYIPSVVQDNSGQPHVVGAQTFETLTLLDGFNVTQPANGLLLLRVNTDAIRSINVETSRYSAEQGKGSGGVLDINTGIGDDHYRVSATNFIPSIQFNKGVRFDSIFPRFTFSGPIQKGRIWFFEGLDGEYDNVLIKELPDKADTDHVWRIGNIAKVQMNLSPGNIVTLSYVLNRLRDQHAGLSPGNPIPTTPVVKNADDIVSIKNQHYFAGGDLLEAGFAFDRYTLDQIPLGTLPYVITPEGAVGNHYLTAHTQARRWQALTNFSLAPRQWGGRHEVRVGIDLDRITYHPSFNRSSISFLGEGQTLPPGETCFQAGPTVCTRLSLFNGFSETRKANFEVSGYIQDRWSPAERLLIEPGLRYDWDQIVRRSLLSPRLAATYVFDHAGRTKISAGWGIFYDATSLLLVARPFVGTRQDFFFNSDGTLISVPTTFSADLGQLQEPRFMNWSLSLERKLPAEVFLKVEYLRKRGIHGFVYDTPSNSPLSGNYFLRNTREDHYDALQVTGRHTFRKTYLILVSYTRSRARSNQVLDFNVDSPIFGSQLPGPYPWDSPNRLLSWGMVPLIRGFDLAWSTEARSGFPFNVVNDQLQLIPPAGSHRFPTYFTLNLFLEKRFHVFKRYWAVRGGFDNVTNHKNPFYVNNDIDSPQFLQFGAFGHRAFTARVRLLGRK